jgi:hypothetical protein
MSGFTNSFGNVSPPTGSIIACLLTSDPNGWVIMDGISRNNTSGIYNNLINLSIGSGTLNYSYTPPNYSGTFLRGTGSASSNNVGPAVGAFQGDNYGSHTHTASQSAHNHTFGYKNVQSGGSDNGVPTYQTGGNLNNYTGGTVFHTADTTPGITVQASGTTETRGCNYGVNWILKL